MKTQRFTGERIIGVPKEAEACAKPAELYRRRGISEPTDYNWRARFAGMTISEARRLHVLLRREGFVVNRKRVQKPYRVTQICTATGPGIGAGRGKTIKKVVERKGIEPSTFALRTRRSPS